MNEKPEMFSPSCGLADLLGRPKKATPHADLLLQLYDSRLPKTEREHAAVRELERLAAENEALTATRDRQAAMLRRLEERETELDAEIGRLRDELRQSSIDSTRAEVERLREQIKDCDGTIEALQSAVARAAQKVLAGT